MDKSSLPNYQRIKQELLQEIERGAYRTDQPFITQQEVCRRFQVSRITAERSLNELVRDGILIRRRGQGTFVAEDPVARRAAADVAYHSLLLPEKKMVIACIVSVTRSEHKTAIIRGVDHICREADCHLLFFDSGESPEIEASNLQRAADANVSGIIIYPVDGIHNTDLFEEIRLTGIPIVMVDRYYPTLPTDVVVPDNVAAGYEITHSLIEQGHQIIATIWQEIACTSVQERLIGYKQAMREANLQIASDMATLRSYNVLSEEERRVLLSNWLASPHPPTAILAANSYVMGILALDLLSLGVQIGKEVMLAAMDKDDPGIPLTLGTASVLLPSYEMGCEAMRILLKRSKEPDLPTQYITLPVTLSTPSSAIAQRQTTTTVE